MPVMYVDTVIKNSKHFERDLIMAPGLEEDLFKRVFHKLCQ
jgi:hypothetical protein